MNLMMNFSRIIDDMQSNFATLFDHFTDNFERKIDALKMDIDTQATTVAHLSAEMKKGATPTLPWLRTSTPAGVLGASAVVGGAGSGPTGVGGGGATPAAGGAAGGAMGGAIMGTAAGAGAAAGLPAHASAAAMPLPPAAPSLAPAAGILASHAAPTLAPAVGVLTGPGAAAPAAGGARAAAAAPPNLVSLITKITQTTEVRTFATAAKVQLEVYAAGGRIPEANQRAAIVKQLEARSAVQQAWLNLIGTHPTSSTVALLDMLAMLNIPNDRPALTPHTIHWPKYEEGQVIANHFKAFIAIADQHVYPMDERVTTFLSTLPAGSTQDLALQWKEQQPMGAPLDFEDFHDSLVKKVDGRNRLSDAAVFEAKALLPSETIPAYTNNLRLLANRAYPTLNVEARETLIAKQFKLGLPGELRRLVVEADLWSVEELMHKAIAIEARMGPACRIGRSGIDHVIAGGAPEVIAPLTNAQHHPDNKKGTPTPSSTSKGADKSTICSNCAKKGHNPDTCFELHPELAPKWWKRKDSAESKN